MPITRGMHSQVAAIEEAREGAPPLPSRLHALFEATSDLIWFADADGIVTSVNAAARELLGWDPAAGVHRAKRAFSVASQAVLEVDAAPKLRADGAWSGDLTIRTADGTSVPVSVAMLSGQDAEDGSRWVAVVARDLRKARDLEQQARHQATHDSLTGLANRDGLETTAAVTLAQGAAALLLLDVDHLRLINDGLSFDAGDAVLVELARRVRACLRDEDMAARIGGDELAVLLPGATLEEAAAVAARIASRLEPGHRWGDRQVRLTASIGVADASTGDGTLGRLLQQAELAVLLAKASGGGATELYDAEVHDRLVARTRLRQDLGEALERNQFHLLYQPIISFADGRLTGVESLLRWRHPDLGIIGPDVFVPLLEETGWIVPTGLWIIDEALRQLAAWQTSDPTMRTLRINVNVSALQLSPELVTYVAGALATHGIEPDRLTLEITETALARDADDAGDVLHRLHGLGLEIAMDDFGTGYSSLASVQSMPISQLKIDKSFIDGVTAGGRALTAGVTQMALALGLRTVAEGVEHAEQAAVLEELGCHAGQGYLWSRPLPPDEVAAFHTATAGSTTWSESIH